MAARPLLFALFVLTLPLPGLLLVLGTNLRKALRGPGALFAVAALLSFAVTSVAGLSAALAGVFSLGLVIAVNAGCAALLLAVRGRLLRERLGRLPERVVSLRRGALLALLPAAAAALLFLQPYEQFLGGWDPGVYVNAGMSLARTGGITIRDRALPAVPEEERDLFLYERRGLAAKYPGFVVRDAERGILQPYFNHLYPVWIAIFVSGLGPRAGLFVAPLFALLSVGMLALLGRVLFSRYAGGAAALLFGLSIPAIWSARFQTAEPVALFFSLGGWFAATLFLRGRRDAWALVSAALFGCALLAKITTFLPVALLLGVVTVLTIASRDIGRAVLPAALGAALLAVLPYALTASREYTAEVFRSVLSRRGLLGAGLPFLAAGAATATWIAGALLRRSSDVARKSAAALVAGLGIYGYFLRPVVEHSTDAANLPQLAWFVTPLAPALAMGGVLACLLGGRPGRRREARLVFLAVAAATTTLVLYRKQIAPMYLWALRRYVPEVLPAIALFGGAALALLCRPGAGRRIRVAAAGVLLGVVCGLGIWRGRHLLPHREYVGAFDRIAAVASHLPEGSLTVCREGWLSTPLQLLFGRETLAVYDLTPAKGSRLAGFLAARAAERPLYLAAESGDFVSRRAGLELVAKVAFDLPELERSRNAYPHTVERFAPEVFLFRVVSPPGSWHPARIAVAQAPLGLGEGFHGPERTVIDGEARSFRWTGASATLDLPEPPPGHSCELELRLGGGRPPGFSPPRVRLLSGGRILAEFEAGQPGIATYRFVVPTGVMRDAGELTLESDTFVPAMGGGSQDRRALGVMVEEVALLPLPEAS